MEAPQRILIIRPSALGDVCRSVPLLVSLKRAFSAADVDWLVQEDFADAIVHHPDLQRVVAFPRSRLGRWWFTKPSGRSLFRSLLGALRAPAYDLVVDAQGLGRSGFFARMTGASRRIGFRDARELGWLGLNERVSVDPSVTHTVDRMLALVEGAGITPVRDMRLHSGPVERAWVSETLGEEPFAVLAPTSRWPAKRWPEERFLEVARALLEQQVPRVVIVAARSERDQCPVLLQACARDPRLIDLTGRTTVGQLMAVVERCTLLLANDSAALHIGVGFDRPLVALFGPTLIDRVGPYRRERDVIQAQLPSSGITHKDEDARTMMLAIESAPVIDACAERLASVGSAP